MHAPDFVSGQHPPRLGMFLVALDPAAVDLNYIHRVQGHLERLSTQYGIDFGRHSNPVQRVALPDNLYARLRKTG